MARVLKKCKVCGKEYEYCHTLLPGVFRWQDVACCHEHALTYFAQCEAARNESSTEEQRVEDASEAQTETVEAGQSSDKPVNTKKAASKKAK